MNEQTVIKWNKKYGKYKCNLCRDQRIVRNTYRTHIGDDMYVDCPKCGEAIEAFRAAVRRLRS